MPALYLNLSEAEIDRLNYEAFHYPCTMIQRRIFSVYLKAKVDFSLQMISLITGLCPNIISHWIHVYQAAGIEGLMSNHYGTNSSQLEEYSSTILEDFKSSPPRTAAEA